MPIGTASGKHYEDAWSQATGQHYDDSTGEEKEALGTRDKNVIDPETFFSNKRIAEDPNVITNDQGEIVDYHFGKIPSLKEFDKKFQTKPEMQLNEADPQFVPISDTKLDRFHGKVDDATTPAADAIEDRIQSTVDFIRSARRSSTTDTDRALAEIRRALEETGGAEPVSRQGSEPGDRSHSPRLAGELEQTPFLGGMSDNEFMAYVQNNPNQGLDPLSIERYDALVPRGLESRESRNTRQGRDMEALANLSAELRSPRGWESVGGRERRPTLSTGESLDEGRPFSSAMKERISEAKSGKDLNFFSKKGEADYGKHYFASEKGVGVVNVGYRAETKTIKVSSIGIIEDDKGQQISPLSEYSYKHGPGTFGGKETKQVLKYLKEKYPDAEWITGFRVSGARQKTGSGSDTARMWIGKGPKPKEPQRKTMDQLAREFLDGED